MSVSERMFATRRRDGVCLAAPGLLAGGGRLRSRVMDAPQGFERLEGAGPFIDHIGPVYVREAEAGPVFGLRAAERHLNHRGTVQGGMLSTFADFAMGRALEDAGDGGDRATVSLTVDFLKPAEPGDWIESRTKVDRVGSTLSFVDVSLVVEEREIVRGRAVWVSA